MSLTGPTQVGTNEHFQDLNSKTISEKTSVFCGNTIGELIEAEPDKEDLNKYVDMVVSQDKATQLLGLIAIRKLLSLKENPPIQEVVDSGIVPKLLEFMKLDNETKFQYESAWAVTNICSGTSQDVEYVVNLGGLEVIINLLKSNSVEVLDQAVWALGNIAGDNTSYRNMCLERESMDKLVTVVQNHPDNASIKRNTIWAMSNLLRGKPIPQWHQISKGLPVFKQIIADSHFGEALIDALWGLSWASETYIQEVINLECIPYLVHHLKNNQLSVLIPSLRALGNIVTGNDSQTNAVLSCPDFLPRVFELTSNQKKAVRKEACWLISNIAAGTQFQIALIIEQPHYIEALKKALTQDLQDVVTEAAWSLGNLVSGATSEQIAKMVNEYGYLDCLRAMLGNFSQKVKQIGLEACMNVLNSGGEEGNMYVKNFIDEDLITLIKGVLDNGTQAHKNIAEDILAFFKQAESKKEAKIVEKKEIYVKAEESEDEDDELEEDEEEEEACDYELRQDEEEDDEKYKNMERED